MSGSTDAGRRLSPIHVLPDLHVDLVASITLPPGPALVELSVHGLRSGPLRVEGPEPVENLAVELRAETAHALFGVEADTLRDRAVPLAELWGPAARDLGERLVRAGGFAARKAVVERALLERAVEARSGALHAAEAVRRIERSGGRISISTLARSLGLGERRLLRLFRTHVGLAPKPYARLVRFRRAYAALERGSSQLDAALACGYADQPHLLREFRRFTGSTPRAVGFVQSREPATH